MASRLLAELTARPFSRAVLVTTMVMTWRVTVWAFEYASAHTADANLATVLLAITAPFTALQAAAFKVYTDGKEASR